MSYPQENGLSTEKRYERWNKKLSPKPDELSTRADRLSTTAGFSPERKNLYRISYPQVTGIEDSYPQDAALKGFIPNSGLVIHRIISTGSYPQDHIHRSILMITD
jgi:hypothetical protein